MPASARPRIARSVSEIAALASEQETVWFAARSAIRANVSETAGTGEIPSLCMASRSMITSPRGYRLGRRTARTLPLLPPPQ